MEPYDVFFIDEMPMGYVDDFSFAENLIESYNQGIRFMRILLEDCDEEDPLRSDLIKSIEDYEASIVEILAEVEEPEDPQGDLQESDYPEVQPVITAHEEDGDVRNITIHIQL